MTDAGWARMLFVSAREGTAMQRAAQAATIRFAGLIVFQAARAAGAPLGDAAWGGAHAHLTTGQRVGSAVAVVFYYAAIVVLHARAAGRAARRYRWGAWALVVVLATSAAMNAASDNPWESYLLAPLALVLAGLCLVVARSAGRTTARSSPSVAVR